MISFLYKTETFSFDMRINSIFSENFVYPRKVYFLLQSINDHGDLFMVV